MSLIIFWTEQIAQFVGRFWVSRSNVIFSFQKSRNSRFSATEDITSARSILLHHVGWGLAPLLTHKRRDDGLPTVNFFSNALFLFLLSGSRLTHLFKCSIARCLGKGNSHIDSGFFSPLFFTRFSKLKSCGSLLGSDFCMKIRSKQGNSKQTPK